MRYYEDPILGKGRAADVSGGTGGGGGTTYIAGDGLNLSGQTFSLATAEVQEVLNGTQTVEAVDVSALRGALTAGQAVDVTSQPDGVTGDYKSAFTVSGSLGFASFPKFATGLNYLMIADLTATTSGTVTPSGTWLDGTTTAKTLTAGTSTRVAMLFNAANKAKFTFASTGSVSVSNCREYEVTACSNEAIAYIAALSNPDAFADYYLVKADMVQPWTYIIDMGTSPAVTIASGLSYKLNAATGTHTLTVDTCPAGYDGRDAIIRICLGGTGVIQAVAPLQLGGALVPYAINNCVVRFRDGEAVLLVEDTLAGYVVTVNTGTGEGSLPNGLAATGVPYIAFSPSTDGIPVDISGATTAAEEVTVVGNGFEDTILTGSITCTSKTIVANLALQNVVVNGGTMTLGDAYIPSGSTVAVSGGGLAVEKVTGDGGTIDLGGTYIATPKNSVIHASGVIITGGANGTGGAYSCILFNANTATAYFSGCTFSGNTATSYAGGAIYTNRSLQMTSCTVSGNKSPGNGGGIMVDGESASVVLYDCTISGNTGTNDIYNSRCATEITDCTIGKMVQNAGTVQIGGSNTVYFLTGTGCSVTITSGTSINLTSSINPGGGITVLTGGCTVNGVTVQPGTYTSIVSSGGSAVINQ